MDGHDHISIGTRAGNAPPGKIARSTEKSRAGNGNSVNLSRLNHPDVFGTLLAELGAEPMFQLIEKFGGTRLFVAKVPRKESPVVSAIGMLAACQLSAKFGSDTIALPLARNWRIQVYRARGWSYPKIAIAVGVSEATVARCLKNMGLTHSPAERTAPAGASEGVIPEPLACVRMPVIRRGTGPNLPLFQVAPAAVSAPDAGAEHGNAPHV